MKNMKNAEAMVKVFEHVISILTLGGALIKAVASLLDYLSNEEE